MPVFSVRFKGMLTGDESKRLAAAGIELAGSKASMRVPAGEMATISTGRPIYTVKLEASDEQEALARVRAAIEPDTANFSGWEAAPG